MYLSSSGVHCGCSSGLRYIRSQSASHTNPSDPVNKNAQRQPRDLAIHGMNRGVIIAPTLVPALKIPVASARSFFGNHSATALMLAGKTAASPKPRATRETAKLVSEFPSAVPIEARLQKIIASA